MDERTPSEWLAELHPDVVILDPDGWRGKNGRPFTDPISKEEFSQRLVFCTLEWTKLDGRHRIDYEG